MYGQLPCTSSQLHGIIYQHDSTGNKMNMINKSAISLGIPFSSLKHKLRKKLHQKVMRHIQAQITIPSLYYILLQNNCMLMDLTFRPGLRHITLIALGTTMRFLRSYGGGQPSYTFNLLSASLPR